MDQAKLIRTMSMPLTFRALFLTASFSILAASAPVLAQPKSVEGRVDKLEKEMQAVQRKVFPGGAGQIVSPDVTPQAPPVQAAGTPASTPIADLTARVGAIESQVARLTGQVEETGFRLKQLEDANAKLTAQYQALQAQVTPPPVPEAAVEPQLFSVPAPPPGRTTSSAPASRPPAAAATKPAATKPVATPASSAARTQAVAAIEKPNTGNAPLDGYSYGFRLWTAKFYPEAEVQLEDTLAKYGSDPVASRTANLLGRAYLDDNKPTQAAKILFENYQKRPKGDRASESLAWVGEALIQLNKPKDACLAYEELESNFGTTMPANVRDMMTKGRVRAKCGA
jgi:TolA-binding protein